MSFSADVNVAQAIKCVSDALRLDSNNRVKDAYVHYLNSVQFIVHVLLQDVNAAMNISMNTKKFVQMGQQCLERLSVLLQSLPQSPGGTSVLQSLPQSPCGTYMAVSPTSVSVPHSPGDSVQNFPQCSASQSGSIRRTSTSGITSSRRLVGGPIQEAERKNQKLMAAYRARMARAQTSRSTHETASLNMSMQRKMAENMALARAREQALTKRLEERQRRLEEEAARRFESLNQTAEEREERQSFYTEILKYEEDVKWLTSWRDRLKMYPDDTALIQQLIQAILLATDHPLSQLLFRYQTDILQQLKSLITKYMDSSISQTEVDNRNEAANTKTLTAAQGHEADISREAEPENMDLADGDNSNETERNESEPSSHAESSSDPSPAVEKAELSAIGGTEKRAMDIQKNLHNVTQEIHRLLHKLLLMFVVTYEQLDNTVAHDLCYDGIEETFFTPIWKDLITLFRLASRAEERVLESVITSCEGLSPEDLSVGPKFSLHPMLPSSGSYPYEAVVNELQQMTQLASPLNKLACLVRVSHLICHCIEEHYANQGQTNVPKIGADDLIPILSFVIIKCRLPQLVSECRALEEFIHDGYLNGEEGYCLTSLQTALAYIATLAT